MSASLIGRLRSSTFRLSATAMSMSLTGSCFSSESAPGPLHHGIRGRGRTNNLIRGLVVSLNGRFKQTCELTSSIVPRGTSFHCWVDLEFPPIGFDPERLSCGCRGWLAGPPELGAIDPDAVHDDGQPTGQCHDRLLHSAAPGDLHGPGLEPGPFLEAQHLKSSAIHKLGRPTTPSHPLRNSRHLPSAAWGPSTEVNPQPHS